MNRRALFSYLLLNLFLMHTVLATAGLNTPKDSIKTYTLGEVLVVSSSKETNNLQKLPGAASFLSSQAIANRQIRNIKDLSLNIPNLYIPDYGAKLTSAVYIRGVGTRSSGQSIGLYVDDVPYLDKSSFDFEFMDIKQIEVLRGPQGTLYGRNAMGGIIRIQTLSPLDYQGTKASLSVGNQGQYNAKVAHYRKLGAQTGLSTSVYYNHQNGFFKNWSEEGKEKRLDSENSVGGRLKFETVLNDRLKANYAVQADYTDQGGFPYGLYNQETGVVAPVQINDPSSYKRFLLSNHLQLEYKTRAYDITSTTGYQYLKDDMKMDQDFSPLSIFTLNQKQQQNAYSEEIAIKSHADRDYKWSFGVYTFYNSMRTEGPVTFKKDGITTILQPVFDQLNEDYPKMPLHLRITDTELYIPGSFKTPSYGAALFHQFTYDNLLTNGLSLTAGVRLDYEKQKMQYDATAKMNLSATFLATEKEMDLSQLYNASVMDEQLSQAFKQLLPKISLKYECTPHTFTYLSASKGYKAGGYNIQMSADLMQSRMQYDMMKAFEKMMGTTPAEPASIQDVTSYRPETSWNYELGTRSELIKDRVHVDMTLFYMDIKDIQITRFVNSGNGRILANAGKADSYGAELSLQALISDELSADINYGYTHATFRDYNNGKQDFKGNFIPYTPRHTFSLGLQYTKPLRDAWIDQFFISQQYKGAGKIFWTEENSISQSYYATLDAKIGFRKGKVQVSLWGRNLTNTDYAAFYFESFGNSFIQKGKPAQFGAEINLLF